MSSDESTAQAAQREESGESDEEEFSGEELQVAPGGDDDGDHDDDYGDHDDDADAGDESGSPDHRQPMPPPRAPVQRFAPRDPSEILRDVQFDHLTPGDQAEALRQAGGRAENSIDRARRDVLQERELAARAVVYREWPEEYQGKTIKGRVRQWKAPFTLDHIEDWVATYRGGGKYKIQFYRGDGRYLESKVLDVEGDPILPGVKEDAEEQARASGGGSAGEHSAAERAAALERQLAEERFERRMAEERARSDAQMGSISHALASLAEAIKQKPAEPAKPALNIAEIAAAAGPVVQAYLASQDSKAAEATKQAREDRKWMHEQQQASEKRLMELMAQTQGKKESMSDFIKAFAEVKKVTGGDNTEARAFNKILDTALPRLIDATTKIQLHKAGVTDGKDDDEEFGAKMIVDRVTDLASSFIASRGAPAQQGQPVADHAQATHGGYGVPVQPQQQLPYGGQPQPQQQQQRAPRTPTRGGGQIVTPEQQATLEAQRQQGAPGPAPQGLTPDQAEQQAAAQQAAAQAAQQAAEQGLSPEQSAAVQQQAAEQAVAAVLEQQAARQQASTQQAAAQAAQQAVPAPAQQADVNFAVFDRALGAMASGKLGSELAEELMREEEQHNPSADAQIAHLYLSPRVVQYLCSAQPSTVLMLLNPQIQQAVQQGAPYAPLLDHIGQQFLTDFCLYFSDPDDSDDSEDGGGGDSGGGDSADDEITGGGQA